MPQLIELTKNSLAVGFLMILAGTAVLTTLTLSPVSTADTAGAYDQNVADVEILSNPIPLTLTDLYENSNLLYRSQLTKSTDRAFSYHVKFDNISKGYLNFPFLTITNPNSAPVAVFLSLVVPEEVTTSISVEINTPSRKFVIYDGEQATGKNIRLDLAPDETITMQVGYSASQEINFATNFSFQITY